MPMDSYALDVSLNILKHFRYASFNSKPSFKSAKETNIEVFLHILIK